MFVQLFQIILNFCMSVSLLDGLFFFTEITQILGYLQFWIRYLSEISRRHSWDFDTQFPNKSDFLYVCQSVGWLTSILKLDI